MTAPTGGLVPNDEAARHPMLERLDAFVGEWSIEASFGPGVTGRTVFEWALDGQFLVERSEVPDVPAPSVPERFERIEKKDPHANSHHPFIAICTTPSRTAKACSRIASRPLGSEATRSLRVSHRPSAAQHATHCSTSRRVTASQ